CRQTCDANNFEPMLRLYPDWWSPLVSLVSSRGDFKFAVTRPPPLTSLTGFKSRIMASLMSFLTRRQADRTILMFGICFIFKLSPPIVRRNLLAGSPSESKPKKVFDGVGGLMRMNHS